MKYLTSIWIGRPRCTSNWLKMPALDFSSTPCDRSVATISVRQPASAAPHSFRHIAIEYGSCPVEDAAHQIRKARRAARACTSAGSTVSLQMIERNLVAEEERLVGGHRLDHLRRQRLGAALHLLHEFGECREGRPCAPAASGGFRPDIACRRTDRARNALSEACADTHSPNGVTNDLPKTTEPVSARSD